LAGIDDWLEDYVRREGDGVMGLKKVGGEHR
jgi:hypothetical protein